MKTSVFFVVVIFLAACCPAASPESLPEKQRGVAERYAQLEQILYRMSEASASSNPRRAALLRKVLLESKGKLVSVRLENLVQLLQQQRFTETIDGQESLENDLLELLRLLESENRDRRRDAEKERVKQFLRELEELIHREKALRARTASREDERLDSLEEEQRDIRLKTQSLRDRMADRDQAGSRDDESDPKAEQAEAPEKQDADASPTDRAMRRARDRMNRAEKKLNDTEKSGALEEQEEAIAELQRAKAELERILRQIREEELTQTLEKLDARFKRMLRIERSIRTETEKLGEEFARADESDRRRIRIRASRLGADQQSVVDDADAALVLLREDGTAQAMVESLLQARFDMTEAKRRLDRSELDSVTLSIEDAVVLSLEEMLDAIDTAIKEAAQRRGDPPATPSGGGETPEDEPLIQLLSELRMIRSMQRRVNERTERYEKEIDRLKNASDADLRGLRLKVEELARQQSRISRILHDLKIGKAR